MIHLVSVITPELFRSYPTLGALMGPISRKKLNDLLKKGHNQLESCGTTNTYQDSRAELIISVALSLPYIQC